MADLHMRNRLFRCLENILRFGGSGVVDENVEAPEFGFDEIEEFLHLLRLSDVGLERNGGSAFRADFIADALRVRRIGAVVCDDGCAFFREHFRNAASESARSSGHKSDFPFKILHDVLREVEFAQILYPRNG